MPLLRLEIYQPHAHYRIPYSINRRLTYPIPPYSTVIGFLCNICGVDDQHSEVYSIIRELKISIAGRFDSKTTENIWFRNLSRKEHNRYYFSETVRYKNGQVGHVGGQIPVKIDVLENVELVIHLYHKNEEHIEMIKQKLENPVERLQPLHLGRAEDLLVIRDLKVLKYEELDIGRVDGNYDYFFWIPEDGCLFVPNPEDLKNSEDLKNPEDLKNSVKVDWREIEGNIYFLTTLSNIEGYESHRNHAVKKTYKKIKVKLSDGKIKSISTLIDKEKNIPIFLAELNCEDKDKK
ncbi:MAG: type I-B CRISPR-associated protein Cas5b [Desulfurococcaceae archaeon]